MCIPTPAHNSIQNFLKKIHLLDELKYQKLQPPKEFLRKYEQSKRGDFNGMPVSALIIASLPQS